MLVGEKGLTCVGGKLFFFFRVIESIIKIVISEFIAVCPGIHTAIG